MGDSCFICEKQKGNVSLPGGVIYEDDYVAVTHILYDGPVYLGYCMIDLKRHAPTLADMTIDEAQAFGVAMMKISHALKVSEGAEHIYSIVSGNAVPHLHMHIVPRYPNTPREYWDPYELRAWPDAPVGGPSEMEAVCNRLKTHLQGAAVHE